MKHEIYGGDYVGTAEWMAPGNVALDVDDPNARAWFERFFATERSFLTGAVDCPDIHSETPNESAEAFERSLDALAGHAYSVRGGSRHYEPAGRDPR